MTTVEKNQIGDDASPGKVAIVQISDSQVEPRGGTDSYVKGLANALEKRGIDVWRVDVALSQPRQMEHEIIIANRWISNYWALLFLCRAALRMRKEKDWIVHVQRPDQLVPFLLVVDRKRLYVTTVTGPNRTAMTMMRPKLIAALYSLIEMIGFRIAGAVIFVDKKTSDFYVGLYPWLGGKSYIIPTGIGSEFFQDRLAEREAKKQFGFGEDERVICFIGRLGSEKNVDLILRSFARIHKESRDLRLAIAGDGDQREYLERLSKDLGIEGQVTFLGRSPHSKIRDLLSASEILVLASKWEGSPTVAREALASRTRIVAANVGDVGELIRDASLGLIIPETTEQALAEGILSVLQMERQQVIQPFVREFCWDKVADKIVAIYKGAQ